MKPDCLFAHLQPRPAFSMNFAAKPGAVRSQMGVAGPDDGLTEGGSEGPQDDSDPQELGAEAAPAEEVKKPKVIRLNSGRRVKTNSAAGGAESGSGQGKVFVKSFADIMREKAEGIATEGAEVPTGSPQARANPSAEAGRKQQKSPVHALQRALQDARQEGDRRKEANNKNAKANGSKGKKVEADEEGNLAGRKRKAGSIAKPSPAASGSAPAVAAAPPSFGIKSLAQIMKEEEEAKRNAGAGAASAGASSSAAAVSSTTSREPQAKRVRAATAPAPSPRPVSVPTTPAPVSVSRPSTTAAPKPAPVTAIAVPVPIDDIDKELEELGVDAAGSEITEEELDGLLNE